MSRAPEAVQAVSRSSLLFSPTSPRPSDFISELLARLIHRMSGRVTWRTDASMPENSCARLERPTRLDVGRRWLDSLQAGCYDGEVASTLSSLSRA